MRRWSVGGAALLSAALAALAAPGCGAPDDATGAAGWGDGEQEGWRAAATGARPVPAATRGLSVSAPIEVRSAVAALRSRFRAVAATRTGSLLSSARGGSKLIATGPLHRIEVAGDGSTRILSGVRAARLRDELRASLRARRVGSIRTATATTATTGGAAAAATAAAAPATLELRTLSVGRAGYECVAGAGRLTVDAHGVARRLLAGCAERWASSDQGGEVAFELAARPAGAGDLVIALGARMGRDGEGAELAVSSDARGLHLASRAPGSERFFFGHGTWVDATGARSPVPARWSAGRIELVVPADLVDRSRYPAVLDPVVGPDLGTDRPVIVPVQAGSEPEIAFDGSSFLVVFEDFQRIRAVRVDPTGRVLDDTWIDLGEDGAFQFSPGVAFGGGRYLVVWWQSEDLDARARGRLLESDGTPVGADSFELAPDTGLDAAAVWNGETFLASWASLGEVSGTKVVAVDSGGEGGVVPGSERLVSTPGASTFRPQLANGTTVTTVAWEDQIGNADFSSRIWVARLARDGTVLDPGGIRISADDRHEENAALAANGDSFLVAWRRSGDVSAPGTIRAALLDGGGAAAVVQTPDFAVSRSVGETWSPSVAFDGQQFLAAWIDQREATGTGPLVGASISATGALLGDADVRLSALDAAVFGGFGQTSVIWNGSRFLVAFMGVRTGHDLFPMFNVSGVLVAPDLTITADALSFAGLPNGQLAPQVAWNGDDYLVAWIDARDPGGFVQATTRAVRISEAGVVRDPDGIQITPDDSRGAGALASNGDGRSFLAWSTPAGQGLFRRIGAGGGLGPVREASSSPGTVPMALAGNGNTYLMVLGTPTGDEVTVNLSARLLREGGALGPEIPVRSLADAFGAGAIATTHEYFVRYFEGATGKLIPVGRAGRVGEPLDLPGSSTSIAAATGPDHTLVTWAGTSSILARRFARGDFRGDVIVVAESTGIPAVAWDGDRYWVVWSSEPELGHALARPVSARGVLGDTVTLVEDECNGPSVASNGNGQLLLACYKFSEQFRLVRVTTRLVDTTQNDFDL